MGASTMKRFLRSLLHDERGELEDVPGWTILTIGGIMLVGVVVLLGRHGYAVNTVQQAAYAAARDASLSRANDAVPHAITAAEIVLGDNVECIDFNVEIGGNGLHTNLGEAGTISATIQCTIAYSDIAMPGLALPGTFTVEATAHSPVDPYRER